MDIAYLRFFAVSITLHVVLFLILNSPPRLRVAGPETIPVSILDTPAKQETELTRVPQPRAQIANVPAIIGKKDSRRPSAKPEGTKDQPKPSATKEQTKPGIDAIGVARGDAASAPTPPTPPAPAREIIPEQSIVGQRRLPTMKELLPPVSWSSSDVRSTAPVSLNTTDPVYVSYFNKIKQMINSQWEYPELALRYGLEGKLSVEFTISANGRMERLRLVRSSGSEVLDQEALRAIKAAAPFPPIPRWIQPNPLTILGEMIYDDNRLDYQFRR